MLSTAMPRTRRVIQKGELNTDQLRILRHTSILNRLIIDQITDPLSMEQSKEYFQRLIATYDLLVHAIEDPELQSMAQHISPLEPDPCSDNLCM